MARKSLDESQAAEDKSLLHIVLRMTAYITVLIMLVLAVDWVFRARTLPVNEVRLQGEFNHVSREDIGNKMYAHVTDNYLVLNLDAIKQDIESLPWVYKASVRRSWPSGLHISYIEQELVARWTANEWLNKYGDVVKFTGTSIPQLSLPSITAPAGTESLAYESYLGFMDKLTKHNLAISSITISKRRSWRINLDNGVSLLLGRNDINNRLQRFLDIYAELNEEQPGILARVDLRYTNGFSVKRIKDQKVSYQQTDTESKKLVKGQAYV
jgi:cell division protein FtsQ